LVTTPSIDWESPDLESEWKRFIEHANFIFAGPLSKKSEEEKCNYLMIWVGEKGRKIYSTWNLTLDEKKKLDRYTDKFMNFVKPRTNLVYNRYKFSARVQNESEPFDQFVADLQILVRGCQYDKPDEMVRDCIVFGVKNNKIREKFINIGSEMTLEKTLEIAHTHEVSKTQTMSMMNEEEKVNVIKSKSPKHYQNKAEKAEKCAKSEKAEKCTKCEYEHPANGRCPAYGKQCAKCKAYNHFASE